MLKLVLLLSVCSCGIDNKEFTYNVEFPFQQNTFDTELTVLPEQIITGIEHKQGESRDVIGSAWINSIALESMEGGTFDFITSITIYLRTDQSKLLLAWASNIEDGLSRIDLVVDDSDLANYIYAKDAIVTVTFYGFPDRTFYAKLITELEVDIDVTAAACNVARW